jgi:hypothetical protein
MELLVLLKKIFIFHIIFINQKIKENKLKQQTTKNNIFLYIKERKI